MFPLFKIFLEKMKLPVQADDLEHALGFVMPAAAPENVPDGVELLGILLVEYGQRRRFLMDVFRDEVEDPSKAADESRILASFYCLNSKGKIR